MNIDDAIRKEAEYAAAVFETEEVERYRNKRSPIYRYGSIVIFTCLGLFVGGLLLAIVLGAGTALWPIFITMIVSNAVLIYTLIRIIRPEENALKALGRVALLYLVIFVFVFVTFYLI
jgi:hypothetical protein